MVANRFNRVCVIGLGYVGLPTAAIIAKHGIEVIGVDTDSERVEAVNSGSVSVIEPGLDAMVSDMVAAGMLSAQAKPIAADAFVIAVPTPISEDYAPDLSHIRDAVINVAEVLQAGNLVVLESTLPVGATETCCEWLGSMRSDLSFPHEYGDNSDIRVAYCPERVLPGNIIFELTQNARIVGGIAPSCASRAIELYSVFLKGVCRATTARAAELSKLVENAFRDVNIAFANEISIVCETLGTDPWEVRDLANLHPRVDILKPGTGVGGHCIPVDPWFIAHSIPSKTPLIRAARQVNDYKPEWVAGQVASICKGLENPEIACLGLAYKSDTEDLRESPAIKVIQELHSSVSCQLLVVDPYVAALPPELVTKSRVKMVDLDTALDNAQVVVTLTDHTKFLHIDMARLSGKEIFDARGIWRNLGRIGRNHRD